MVQTKGRAHPGGHLHWGGLKAFADGSLGSRTALMKEPYADDHTTHGIRLTPYSQLAALVQEADAAGLQVTYHASLSETASVCPEAIAALVLFGLCSFKTIQCSVTTIHDCMTYMCCSET